MFRSILVPLTADRRQALVAASLRLGLRLEYAMEGVPAWALSGDGTGRPQFALVPGAPPWAEDPTVVSLGLDRIDRCLDRQSEYAPC